ncbi:gamma-glutamylcyclotransferase family protein [Sinanaerobacter sp. ZZT-01]|uniref:gamma-glutamylcyclotransferase family protein n=1 Tax=Sinanaerobacter sp. ZZT-01 TaxID=3111540 RepID=UPI002D791456|nr:gamma-glutamylcyclotransferase family protein [Sinanaerobacter sp. ZZT-01]WRR94212.1 gamma-glutamylcyclotransferase family protein [Sinanaerobacter sp. ZZT-01]
MINRNTRLYAAYGSNTNLEQMAMRCPNAEVLCIGTLKGYRLTFCGNKHGSGVANIELDEHSSVPIVLWIITPSCEKVLDIYECYPRIYKKEIIDIETEYGTVKAMIYVMSKDYANKPATPGGRYYGVIQKGYEDHELDIVPLITSLYRVSQVALKLSNKKGNILF